MGNIASIMQELIGAVAIMVLAFVMSGCGQSDSGESTGAGPGGDASNAQPPPLVILDGRDLNFGSGVISASSVCQDNLVGDSDKPKQAFGEQPHRQVVWRGVTNGERPDGVGLFFFKQNNFVALELQLSNGDKFDNQSKSTYMTVSGPTNGWYEFSGTVKRAHRGSEDRDWLDAPELSVKGSIACANYGANPG